MRLSPSRLNIYYLFLEKMNSFAEGRYNVSNGPASQIQSDYENKRTDAWGQIEDLGILKRFVSTCTWIISYNIIVPVPLTGLYSQACSSEACREWSHCTYRTHPQCNNHIKHCKFFLASQATARVWWWLVVCEEGTSTATRPANRTTTSLFCLE